MEKANVSKLSLYQKNARLLKKKVNNSRLIKAPKAVFKCPEPIQLLGLDQRPRERITKGIRNTIILTTYLSVLYNLKLSASLMKAILSIIKPRMK